MATFAVIGLLAALIVAVIVGEVRATQRFNRLTSFRIEPKMPRPELLDEVVKEITRK